MKEAIEDKSRTKPKTDVFLEEIHVEIQKDRYVVEQGSSLVK